MVERGDVDGDRAHHLARAAEGASYADAVHRLLEVVRTQLDMDVAWVSEFVGTEQVLRFVDAAPRATAPVEGTTLPLDGSFCARVLDGRFPRSSPTPAAARRPRPWT